MYNEINNEIIIKTKLTNEPDLSALCFSIGVEPLLPMRKLRMDNRDGRERCER